jgi:outer membrane protein assembly factor BamB
MNPRSPFAIAVLVFLGALSAADAQEWTRFRGPNGSGLGVAPNLPEEFSEKDYNWKIELPGAGHSSPVIWGDRIFITGNPKGTTKRVICCVSAKDGKILWQKEYETAGYHLHSDNNYAAASPAVDSERVYFHWASPENSGMAALDQVSGKELWKVDLGPFVSQHGPGTSPIVFEDTVLVNFDQDEPKSFLLALDAKTGKERWRWEHQGTKHSASTPCIFTPKGGAPQVVTMSFSAGLSANDARTGQLAWQLPAIMTKRCVASPFVTSAGVIIAQCGEGRAESFVEEVQPAPDGNSAKKIFEVIRVGGYVPTPIAYGDRLYLWKEDGLVTCLNLADNQQVWSERAAGPYFGSPICVNGRLYNMTVRGDLVVLATGDLFKLIARIPLGEGTQATPAISGGRMYLRTATHLISVGK